MLEEIICLDRDDEDIPTPQGEEENVWEYRERIRTQCVLPEKPPHNLTPEIADGIRFIRHGIAILLPDDFSRDDAFSLFLTRENLMGSYYKIGRDDSIEFDDHKAEAALRSSPYLPNYWFVEPDELIASYRRSLDKEAPAAGKRKRAAWIAQSLADISAAVLNNRPKVDVLEKAPEARNRLIHELKQPLEDLFKNTPVVKPRFLG